jgi:DNA-binding transcriptional LysR family regulator
MRQHPLPPLRLDVLQTFVIVADRMCLTDAALRLYVTPSGISRRIATLEAIVGEELFLRKTTRLLALTAAGRQFLPFARGIVDTAYAWQAATNDLPAS